MDFGPLNPRLASYGLVRTWIPQRLIITTGVEPTRESTYVMWVSSETILRSTEAGHDSSPAAIKPN